MSPKSFLTRVVLENYKSIASCDVRLGPLMFLVGPNAAGKSNFLDALHFVADALSTTLENALRVRGGGNRIAYSSGPSHHADSFGIRLEFDLPAGGSGHYSVRVGLRPDSNSFGRWEVLKEECAVTGIPGVPEPSEFRIGGADGNGAGPHSQVHDRLSLAQAALSLQHPAFAGIRAAYDALSRMQFYQLRPRSIGDVVTPDLSPFLLQDGSNVGSILFRLGLRREDALEGINEYLRVVLPGLAKVRVEPVFNERPDLPVDGEKIALLFEQVLPAGGVQLFWPSQMSEGTLRTLGVLVALLQATGGVGPRLPLVAIEEPEAQVHPAALGVLLDAMREASHSTQVLVTTHSPDLLDDKEVSTEAILAVSAEGGQTRIGPLDEVSRSIIRDRLFTPAELMRMNQLAPEAGIGRFSVVNESHTGKATPGERGEMR